MKIVAMALFILNMSAFYLCLSRGCIPYSSLLENLLTWASPCPQDGSLSGSTLFEKTWLLGSIVPPLSTVSGKKQIFFREGFPYPALPYLVLLYPTSQA